MVGSPAPKLEAQADGDAIEEGKIGGTTSTGRTAVLVGYGVKQTEAVRRPRSRPESDSAHSARVTTGAKPAESDSGHSPAHAPARPRTTMRRPARRRPAGVGLWPSRRSASWPRTSASTSPRSPPPARTAPSPATTSTPTPPARAGRVSPRVRRRRVAVRRPATRRRTPARRASARDPHPGQGRAQDDRAGDGRGRRSPRRHVTMFNDVDVTATMQLVARLKQDREFAERQGDAAARPGQGAVPCPQAPPGMNAVWTRRRRRSSPSTTSTSASPRRPPRALVVPNVKDADRMTMHELPRHRRAHRHRPRRADPAGRDVRGDGDDHQRRRSSASTPAPIINPGESAIVAFGAVRKKPWVVTGPDGEDTLAIRQVSTLAVSFDHRLIDGELGSLFLRDLSALLEDPSRGLVWG